MTNATEAVRTAAAGDRDDHGLLAGRPWAALILLTLIGVLNIVDRVLPAILAEPIKRDLGLSDTALGLINGFGFLVIYAAASIPLAKISDGGRYRLIVTLALAVWSGMTMIGGWTMAGWQLALSRMGVALGEAGGTPAAHAYITRNFPLSQRTRALAVFSFCLPIGATIGFIAGGSLGDSLGWRLTFITIGGFGLLLSVVAYFCLGIRKASAVSPAPQSKPAPSMGHLLRKRSLICILIGASFVGMGGHTTASFGPAYLMRTYGMTLREIGLGYGVAVGVSSTVALVIVGWFADKLSVRHDGWLVGAVIALLAITIPFIWISLAASDRMLAMVGLILSNAASVAYAAPIYAALHRLAPLELRARASALLLLSGALLGGLGPVLAGAISDAGQAELGVSALGRGMLIIPACYVAATVFFAISLLFFGRETVDEETSIRT